MGSSGTQVIVERFNEAFNRHDVDGIMLCMTPDCVFENTRPGPDGTRFAGQDAVRRFWEEFFVRSPQARFDMEELFATDERCVVRWVYHWVRDGKAGHVRGVGPSSHPRRLRCGKAVLRERLR